ncbi:Zn-dependent protease with chaperone function [Winogradskyella wandonensis]|uniref:Zn-dependent protease with chaperone function n=1 Tax=Winogradskyella wandonensis TaxID=1442586 RepID=A0A4R1KPB1_9FLAO|nr:M48 family metalloprotease [Winogradskyella wandonensis]TCK66854.1 Zn-dependent protease with chaperone function [Winogradskyella wandonensis]
MTTNYYPASPTNVPKNLTALTTSYQTRAFLAILAIILFFVLYGALVVALGYLVYWAFTYDIGRINKLTILGKVGAVAGTAMLFFFTLKFIFKLKNHKPENRIKLKKEDYPELWDFILKICDETGAPKPKNIYADPDVNAYVAYSNMWLSLFLPVKKELTIGLGLVSCINMSEFKAVMSHEFGHFSQRSMKIGSYIISANTIIHDMIFARDKWDDILDQWRASDLRLSFAAWVITPIIWVIRQVLALFYQFLNIMYSSLSREMEFNADKVAISTSGSDAIISGLWKLDSGFTKWNSTIQHAYLAAPKKIFTKNLYTHNNLSISKDKDEQFEALSSLPKDERGGKKFFTSSEHSKVNMYASHPPNDMRQDNAKVPYIDCPNDETSPWVLFSNAEKLQEEMTQLIYNQYLNKTPENFSAVEDFENFITTENKDKKLLEEYQNTFENRYLNIPDLDKIDSTSKEINVDSSKLKTLKEELTKLMQPVKDIELLMEKANQIASGTTKEKTFAFKEKSYTKKTLQEGYMNLLSEREKILNENFKAWDTEFCNYHYALAKQKNKASELKKIYKQHQLLSDFYRASVNVKNTIVNELNALQSREVTENDVRRFGYRVNDLALSLNAELDKFDTMEFVSLPNIDTIQELKEAIIEGGEFKKQTGNIFENGGFNILYTAVENATVHCQRIDQKSIGLILDFHNQLQR